MKEHFGYTAEEFFGMINDAVDGLDVSSTASLQCFYACLDKVMHLAVSQRVGDFDIAFAAGLFAKTDYLSKQLGIDKTITRNFNETRDRIRHLDTKTDTLASMWAYDLKAVALFVSAIYGDAEVPESLSCRFPLAERPRGKQKLMAKKMRVVVEGVDGNVMSVVEQASGEQRKVVCRESQKYMLRLVSQGNQLNLVLPGRSSIVAGAIEAEHIILHPDLLVNITSVAACFEDYAEDSKLYLFNKVKPSVSTVHTLLGNLAGMMLDDAIHHRNTSYADSILRFCRYNALSMAACADSLGNDFHQRAKEQMVHIRKVVDNVMPKEVRRFDSREVMLEPSFICEMLGLQGRMDMLQLDFRLLVEQKAGKGVYGYGDKPGEQPRQKTKHYVQLLMYMAVLHYSFNIPYAEIYSFLLYSKYDRSLLQLGSAPELLHRAIMVRNQIAWTEYFLANGGFAIYNSLNANCLGVSNSGRSFFERFIRPQLEEALSPIQGASAVEKAYFYRFMTFVQRESLLSRTGNIDRDDDGFAQLWLLNAREKAEAGNIYYGLTLDTDRFCLDSRGAVESITLTFPKGETANADTSNFRIGDMVIVYPYPKKSEPDARRTMVFKATIADITLSELRLGLHDPQTHANVFLRSDNCLWAVEHGMGDSSSSGLFNGLCSMLSAPESRRQLLLSQRPPSVDPSLALCGDYGAFNQLVISAMQARDMFLVIGPPGTGKTSFAMLNILREELCHEETSVLLLSYTNRAVDEMCSKLVEAGIDFIRVGNKMACDAEYRKYMIDEKVCSCSRLDDIVSMIKSARVVCATVSTVNSHTELLGMRHFSLAIVDEASQILEPHIVGILSAVCIDDSRESIGRFVLIGDHKQLPAVVLQRPEDTRVTDPLLTSLDIMDCRHSLFQRLLRRYSTSAQTTYMLTRQGRMHRDIASFPSRAFYSGLLQPVPLNHQLRELSAEDVADDVDEYIRMLLTRRVAFIDAPRPATSPSDKVNTVEADIIAKVTHAAYKLNADSFSAQSTIGVIVPYRNQIATVRNAIDRYGIPQLHDITIDTVERYQGSQRDIIIYGFTVQHRYQLEFLTNNDFVEDGMLIDPKLNVAMTRARENLVLVGHAPLLRLDPVFKLLIDEGY